MTVYTNESISLERDEETGDVVVSYKERGSLFTIDETDRDYLQDQLNYLRWDEEQQIKERMKERYDNNGMD